MFLKNANIHILEISTSQVFLYTYKHQKGNTTLLNKHIFENTEIAYENIPKKDTLFLFVNNQHVLTKEQTSNFPISSENCDNYIEKTFSISSQDFFYDIVKVKENLISSIIRRQYLEEHISKAKEKGFLVSKCFFGPMSISHMIENLNETEYITSQWIVQPKSNPILKVNSSSENQLDSNSLFAEGIIKKHIAKNETFYGSFQTYQSNLTNLSNAIRNNKTYQLVTAVLLGVLVLISALYYSFQYPKLITLQQQKTLNSARLNKINQLKIQISKQEKLINQINKLSNTDVGNFIDKILLIKPNSISLNQIDFQPLLKKIKKEKNILTDTNTLILKGSSKQHKDIQTWISNLEALDLIASVDILSFNDLKTISEFKLAIRIDENKADFTK